MSAARMHAVESGKDLSARTMIAFGGNGPLHATRVARRAGVRRILIPTNPSVGSAVGFLFAPVSFKLVRSRYTTLTTLDCEEMNDLFATMIAEAEDVVRAGAPESPLVCCRTAFMRYHGQGHEIEIPLPDRPLTDDDIPKLLVASETEYRRQFTRSVPGMTVEILNWAVRVASIVPDVRPQVPQKAMRTVTATSHRRMRCDVTGRLVDAPIFHRDRLRPGDTIAGPALVVEPQTTTLVSRDFAAIVDGDGNIVLTREGAAIGETTTGSAS